MSQLLRNLSALLLLFVFIKPNTSTQPTGALSSQNNIQNQEVFSGQDSEPLPNIPHSIHGHPEEKHLCESRIREIYPRAGETKDSSWLFIVNTDSIKQKLIVEECVNHDKNVTCNSAITPTNGYTTRCKQNYIYRQLLAVTKDKQEVILEDFKIPSHCSCVLVEMEP